MKISDSYLRFVLKTGEKMLAKSEKLGGGPSVHALMIAEGVGPDPLGGEYRVTCRGQKARVYPSLAQAIAASMALNARHAVRIWHTDSEGKKRLVLIDER